MSLGPETKGPGDLSSPEPETETKTQYTDKLAARLEALKAEITPDCLDPAHWLVELAMCSASVLATQKPYAFKVLVETVLQLEELVRDDWGPARWFSFTGDGRRDARPAIRAERARTAKARSLLFQEVVIAGVRDHCGVMGKLEARAYAAGVWPLLSPRDRRALIQSTEGGA